MYTNHRSHSRFNNRPSRQRSGFRFRKSAPSVQDYIARSSVKTSSVKEVVAQEVRFDTLNLPPSLQRAITNHDYKVLTPIQAVGIPAIREGKDIIGIANTGTGKTAAFLIPLVEKIMKNPSYRALIITPTRELALQILEELRKFSQSLPIYNTLCIGQMPIYNQIRQLQRRPHVVVGTPGRLKDLINRKVLQLNQFNMIVLDEADQMLDMGFIHDIKYIISFLPPTRQSLFFSATISTDVNMLIKSFVKNPVTISVKKQETVDIRQNVVRVERGSSKLGTLSTLLKKEEYKKVLVFGRTKRGVDRISKELYSLGFKVTAIHGDRTQYQRQQAIRMFKENHVSIMIATDVAARGIDIANISHVVNFDVPETYEDYIHRIGRTGRANTIGTAVTLVE
ncbi:hypothetical protein A2334_04360 [Candidatus Roizmanbacteria bacterium RIFOXYB2_FULL_38_10]|uniref:RNA helicase n=1 Tax=Candidatus Roizmanbacteria bacterium RIFOXYD1_FULL_38_12 TaxID=1802093 RepID=A0A1F7KZL2_9BACT|nr:MAG: hypothetical protein A3K47_00470 [Candidatus Roizmanbacteria bacterium RIFOXYA2_FULL_38_14]OGK63268.1 MAG: hypothetical protein A3K27_00470 [Candidatus Roizmanbacteria bacterium RIFOXYA1_FULL_37_12]OGK65114.1 MAG: hypothetical protein A3K38_00470 [Candidatus Roizmanbacteria bacterium RIFOXYB1_FULL_40_23]OGK68668.1 MAG: hypothetical protein A2334_04360 [Candidatus Roizmanbacteria bacterium RIFOXYB2_FULL_38_10]OGK69518.1 MAG: hypothetical protein A3K21_00470 [Candidatus Roizmanbacteria ba